MSAGLILVYHRVAVVDPDPWALCVEPGRFAQQLDVLRRHAHPMPLRELVAGLQAGAIPDRAAVVTFDDGYADNLHGAKPLLEAAGVPATVFVATGCLEPDAEFWWDAVERVFLSPGVLPGTLELRMAGETHRWEVGDMTEYSGEDARRHRGWRAWEAAPTTRQSLYLSVWQRMQPLPDAERRVVLDALLAWAVTARKGDRPSLMMSPEDVRQLARGGIIEVGAHTVTHPALATLPPDLQREEIRRSKAVLEGILDRPVTGFAYPFGAASSYSAETVAIVREAGLACACSTRVSAVALGDDVFQLPRVQPQDWDGEEFARRLDAWFA